MRIATPPPARFVGLAGLAAFGAWQWGLLVSPDGGDRVLLALIAAAGAGTLLLLGARRGRVIRAATTAAAMLAATALVLLAAGIPAQLLAPANWSDLLDGIGQGLEGLPSVTVPYADADPWPRLVILVAGGLLVAGAVLAACRPAGGRGAWMVRAVPLSALVLLFVVPAVARELPNPYLRGAAFAVLVATFLWLERVTPGTAPRAGALVAGAVTLGLITAPLLDRSTPVVDVNDLAGSLAAASGATFNWDHRYGPLNWPRDGREVLRIKATHAAYWKTENLDGFDGLRWRRVRVSGDEDTPAALYTHPGWTQDVRVSVRSLRSDEFVGAGSTLLIRGARAVPIPAGSSGTYDAGTALRQGDSYVARVYTPRPTSRELRGATIPAPRQAAIAGSTSALDAYLTVAMPVSLGRGRYAARPDDAAPGAGDVAFPRFGYGGAPAAVANGVPVAGGDTGLRSGPYAGAYAVARRLAAGAQTPYDYVRAVEGYLAKGFRYSEAPPDHAVPLASFLGSDRQGYCQHFSGAMALLLRMGGVPARVATGFAPGAYNRARAEYVVRDDDAHSWVEAYFEPYGWVPFDPTPPAAPAASQANFQTTGSAGTPDPRDTGAGLHKPGTAGTAGSRGGDGGGLGPLGMLGVGALVLGVIGAVAVVLPGRRRRALGPGDPLVAELERALRRTGRSPPPGTTLRGLERRLTVASDGAAYLHALRQHRFAAAAPAPTVAQRRGLRRALARGLGWRGHVRALWALPPRIKWRA